MPTIHITTFIAAPVERVFDLSRSIDLHKKSMPHTEEQAIAGTISGLIGMNESVTWQARHLGKKRVLQSKITALQKPEMFTDEMQKGDFKKMKHDHHFKPVANGTIMVDVVHFEAPYGVIGKLVSKLFLTKYLNKLIEQRNAVIKEYAESEKWKLILN
ncbi:SRPBCC family protein [Pinibacter soli]|uniref:SRPBCC family protein n=1 Tax=Pinibacter soli TaxID=3044211 RepID=A0ABT6RL12_9BACT|nr:SRPBCC family protein [Pinibacter soli]MDI3322517.1 SRPBCC family protein [Pinibacter soli]